MTLHFADLHVAVRFSQLPPTVPRRIVSVEKNLQSQTCLFERYYATFCRPAIANMSLRTILRCILLHVAVRFHAVTARGTQLNSPQQSLAACVSREGERSSFLFPSTRPLTTHTETREFGSPSGRSVLGDHFRWNRAAEIQPQPVVTYMHTAPESLPRGGSRTPRAPPAPSRRSRRARAEARRASKGL